MSRWAQATSALVAALSVEKKAELLLKAIPRSSSPAGGGDQGEKVKAENPFKDAFASEEGEDVAATAWFFGTRFCMDKVIHTHVLIRVSYRASPTMYPSILPISSSMPMV